MQDIYKSAQIAMLITSLNRYALIALSIFIWVYEDFWIAFVIFLGTFLIQRALNLLITMLLVKVKKNFIGNPFETEHQRLWLMVLSEFIVLIIAVLIAKIWI